YLRHRLWFVPSNRLKAKRAHNRRQYYGGFDHGESCSDADTRSAAERQKGITRTCLDPICRKAILIERIRVVPNTDVPMQRENRNVDTCACRDLHASDFHRLIRDTCDSRCGREQPHRFLDNLTTK